MLVDATNAPKSVIIARAAPLHRAFSIGLIYTLSDGINDCNCERFDTKSRITKYTRCEKLQKNTSNFEYRKVEELKHTHTRTTHLHRLSK